MSPNNKIWHLVGGVTTAGLVIASMVVLGLVPLISISARVAQQALPCAEVPGVPQPLEGLRHLSADEQPHPPYRTVPATSGWHSARIFSPGVYREAVPEELQVHFLEHGHIMINYAPGTPAEEIDQLERLARQYPRDIAIAPFPKVTRGVALTGWQRLQRLDHADVTAATLFVERVAGRYNHGWVRGATDCIPL